MLTFLGQNVDDTLLDGNNHFIYKVCVLLVTTMGYEGHLFWQTITHMLFQGHSEPRNKDFPLKYFALQFWCGLNFKFTLSLSLALKVTCNEKNQNHDFLPLSYGGWWCNHYGHLVSFGINKWQGFFSFYHSKIF